MLRQPHAHRLIQHSNSRPTNCNSPSSAAPAPADKTSTSSTPRPCCAGPCTPALPCPTRCAQRFLERYRLANHRRRRNTHHQPALPRPAPKPARLPGKTARDAVRSGDAAKTAQKNKTHPILRRPPPHPKIRPLKKKQQRRRPSARRINPWLALGLRPGWQHPIRHLRRQRIIIIPHLRQRPPNPPLRAAQIISPG